MNNSNQSVELVPVPEDHKLVLSHLLELYQYDFSDFEGTDVNSLGLYGYSYLDYYWTEGDRYAYFIKVNGVLAGFAMICGFCCISKEPGTLFLSEFFVLKKYRKQGIGQQAALELLKRHPGKWEFTLHPENHVSHHFWHSVLKTACGEYTVVDDVPGVYDNHPAQAYLFTVKE
jgi:predicted acetyltransferase